MRKLLLPGLLFCSSFLFAQDQVIQNLKSESTRSVSVSVSDTSKRAWKTGGMFSLNFSQASLSNWSAGGDDFSMALTSYFSFHTLYKKGKHSWINTLDLNIGYVSTTSLGSRKNDDRFDLTSKYDYGLNKKLGLSGLTNIRSQMFDGYTYSGDEATFASTFLSPAYLLASIGLDYHPIPRLSIFASPVTSRWIIVTDDNLSQKGMYGVDSGGHVKNEIGAYLTANYSVDITKTLSYKGRLDLFSNYRHNPKNVDLYFTNLFAVKISKVLSATWNLDLIYDDDTRIFGPNHSSPALQVKSLIGAGLMMKL